MSAIQQTLLAYGASAPLVVSDVFSATTYTGTGVAFDLVNGIDLAGKGGMVWDKSTDDLDKPNHRIFDTQRGNYALVPNSTAAQYGESRSYTGTGYNVTSALESNTPGKKYISWTFRKAPKFFDVFTVVGSGSSQEYAHNLGCQPGFVIYKNVSTSGAWNVRFRAAPNEWYSFYLNTTAGDASSSGLDSFFTPTAVNLLVSSGETTVVYLFPYSESNVQCGKYTGNGSATGPAVTLGWEPQFLMVKNSTGTGDWVMYDSARDATNPRTAVLLANSTAAESTTGPDIDFTGTGFQIKSTAANVNTSGSTYIYMAIRKP